MLILLGPTAVGKSKLAVKLAEALNGEIISADSMQVYKGMDIGTAKLKEHERRKIPHHLIDIKAPDEEWSVADFIERTNKLIDEIKSRGKLPIIVGGTGFYLWSLIEGYAFPITPANEELRKKLQDEVKSKGNEYIYNKLKEVDPETAKRLHVNDTKRITRALEVYELTGKPISAHQKKDPLSNKYNLIFIGLYTKREDLYKKIEQRVDEMIEKGLLDEVAQLKNQSYTKELTSMQALGYKEAMDYLDGKYDLKEMIELLKRQTRNFAKRQMTWFRRFKNVKWFEADTSPNKIINSIKPLL